MRFKVVRVPKEKTPKQKVKEYRRLKKNVGSTLKWMHINEIEENQMILDYAGKKKYVKGIKIDPINIFIEEQMQQTMRVSRLRNVYNKISFKLYHSFVFNPVNLDSDLAYLIDKYDNEDHPARKELLEDEIDKALAFIRDFQELEFFISIQGDSEKEANGMLDELIYEFERAGFRVEPLNIIDFENYSAYIFENQMINDYLFGHGAFQELARLEKDLKK